MAYCNKCGKEVEEGDTFCHACGAPVVRPGGAVASAAPPAGGRAPSPPMPPAAPGMAPGIAPAGAAAPWAGGAEAGEDPREVAERRVKQRMDLWWHLGSYVIVNIFLIIVWAITGAGYPWFVWVMIGWGIGIAFHLMHYFMTISGESRRDDMIQREMERLHRKQEASAERQPQVEAQEESGE